MSSDDYPQLTPERARELLGFVSPDLSREDWLRIGMAIRSGLGDAGWSIFSEWSAGSPKYTRAEAGRQWSSLDQGGATTPGTLYHFAKQGGWQPPARSERAERPPPRRKKRDPNATVVSVVSYVCCDIEGTWIAAQQRENLSDGNKQVRWCLPDGTDDAGRVKWKRSKGLKSAEVPLYNTELLARPDIDTLIVVEGPKAAVALQEVLPATSVALGTVTGADGKAPAPEVLAPIVKLGLPVYLWPDNDTPGMRHMMRLGDALINAGASEVSTIRWPNAPLKSDAADWVTEGQQPPLATMFADATKLEHSKIRKQRAAGITDQFEKDHPTVATYRKQTPFDTSGGRLAERLLLAHASEILVVVDGRTVSGAPRSAIATLGPKGIWEIGGGDERLRGWFSDLAIELINIAIETVADEEIRSTVNRLSAIRGRASIFSEVQDSAAAARNALIATGEIGPDDVQSCRRADLDADPRYLGTASGVVDLHSGELLPPDEGRKHLLTCAAPTRFKPGVRHPDVDQILRFLDPEVADYVWNSIAYCLQGWPTRRFYLVQGPPGGGKTVLVSALAATLGHTYCTQPQDRALQAATGSAGLSPEAQKFAAPARVAMITDPTVNSISTPLLKQRSGDGHQPWRNLYGSEQTARCTASQWIFANPATAPRLATRDPALVERMRVMPWISVPDNQRDEGLHRRVDTDVSFHEALLAHLVRLSAAQTPGKPPDTPAPVKEATILHAERNLSELAIFARRLVPIPDSRLPVSEVWNAWCEQCEESADSHEVGGIKRSGITKALRRVVDDLPATQSIRIASNKPPQRGWRGWRLLPAEEAAEQVTLPAEEALETLTAEQVAERAIQELVDVFPMLPEARREALRSLFHDCEKAALNHRYPNGQELEEAIKQVKVPDSYLRRTPGDPSAGISEEQHRSKRRFYAINHLTIKACDTLPVGPVYEKARERFNNLETGTFGRENVALTFLMFAEWELDREDSPRHPEDVFERAIELQEAELRRDPSKKEYYAADVSDAIRDLAGLQNAAESLDGILLTDDEIF